MAPTDQVEPVNLTSKTEERASSAALHDFIKECLSGAGASTAAASATAQALVDASLRGVDSHGIRLVIHYARALAGGRLIGDAVPAFVQTGPSTGRVDGGDGLGHPAIYLAMDEAVRLARETGAGAVSVINSSHFGAAGCYVMRAVEQGCVGFATCNSDAFVLPHNGIAPFHGTNPIAFAAPVPGERPLLVDMATSVIPWNRVQDLILKGGTMPADVSVDAQGAPTRDPNLSAALLPIGGMMFGYKGAALASIAEVLSAVMTGMAHCSRLPAMGGPDFSTPRHLGHFVFALDPERFVDRERYAEGMRAYLDDLRGQPARDTGGVLAPGDREWAVERERARHGIPIAGPLLNEFDQLAKKLGVSPLARETYQA